MHHTHARTGTVTKGPYNLKLVQTICRMTEVQLMVLHVLSGSFCQRTFCRMAVTEICPVKFLLSAVQNNKNCYFLDAHCFQSSSTSFKFLQIYRTALYTGVWVQGQLSYFLFLDIFTRAETVTGIPLRNTSFYIFWLTRASVYSLFRMNDFEKVYRISYFLGTIRGVVSLVRTSVKDSGILPREKLRFSEQRHVLDGYFESQFCM